jgi:hypothetical protein
VTSAATSRRQEVAAAAHPEALVVDEARLVLAQADAERRLGRKLTSGERRIDLVAVDRALVAGKERLLAAIEAEQRSAARRFARDALAGRSPRMRLRVSPAIRAALLALYDAGTASARGQLRRAGIDPDMLPKAMAAVPVKLAVIERDLGTRLDDLGYTLEHRLAVAVDLSTATQSAIVDAVRGLPGFRSIGADFTTVPFDAGLGSVWDQADAAGVTSSWTYSAVMDASVCDQCAELDGTTYDSWDAIQEVLPDGGPNPDCDGGDRCRCQAVPEFETTGSGGASAGDDNPPPLPGDEAPPLAPDDAAAQIVSAIPGVGDVPAGAAPPVSPEPHLVAPAESAPAQAAYRDPADIPAVREWADRGDVNRNIAAGDAINGSGVHADPALYDILHDQGFAGLPVVTDEAGIDEANRERSDRDVAGDLRL